MVVFAEIQFGYNKERPVQRLVKALEVLRYLSEYTSVAEQLLGLLYEQMKT